MGTLKELRELEPHLRAFYVEFLREYNACVKRRVGLGMAQEVAWAKVLVTLPLNEQDRKRMAAFINIYPR
jgi:hypothetical protein